MSIKNKKKVGILLTCNIVGGIGKLSAMMANDIADNDTNVMIYIPIFPFHTFYFKVFNRPFFWLFRIVPEYLKKWLINRNFVHSDILKKRKISDNKIKIKFVLKTISEKDLNSLDCLILNGIGDVIKYQFSSVPKKIYLVNQLEEIYSGHKKFFQNVRKNFKGNIITHCDFMKKKLSTHVNNIKIVPNPISEGIWKYKNLKFTSKKRKDILVYWKNDKFIKETNSILNELFKLKSDIKITLFSRSLFGNKKLKKFCRKFNIKLLFDQNEKQVANLYLNHNFLLYPNTYEDFGMPPLESLTCGCIPILRPNVGAANMYSINNYNSIHLNNNHKYVAMRIINLLNKNIKLLKIRKNTSKNLNRFNPKNYGNRILNS